MHSKINIPILFLQKRDHFVTSGNKFDLWVVERLLGYEESGLVISLELYVPKHDYYYAYQINRIRKEFPNIIQVIYSM